MKNKNLWIIIAGIAGFTGVALGAFGAHGLKDSLSPEMLETWKTGVLYHLIHAVVIFAVALAGIEKFYKAALFLTIGIILFSFSLYFYTTTGITALAMITPLGGVCFLIGWGMVIINGFSAKK